MNRVPAMWLTGQRPRTAPRLRLFCFPHAGGGATLYHGWRRAWPAEVDVCPVMLPGRERRLAEPLITRLPPLVEMLATALIPYMTCPFAFFGHSMGALISFELARHLRCIGGPLPMHLLLSGYPAVQRVPTTAVHRLPEEEFVRVLRDVYGTPHEVLASPELLELVLPIIRADIEVCETYSYSPEPPLACPITVFGGLDDPAVRCDDLAAWHEQTVSRFDMHLLPGNHLFVQTAQAELLHLLLHALPLSQVHV